MKVSSYSRSGPCACEREKLSPSTTTQYDSGNFIWISIIPSEGCSDNLQVFAYKMFEMQGTNINYKWQCWNTNKIINGIKLTRVSGPASEVSTHWALFVVPLAPKHILLNALFCLVLLQSPILTLSLPEPSLLTGLTHAFPSRGNTLLNCIAEAHLQYHNH